MAKISSIVNTVGQTVKRGLVTVNRSVDSCLRYAHVVEGCATCQFQLGEFLVGRFAGLGYDTQSLRFTDNNEIGTLVQIRNRKGEWKRDAVRSFLGQQLSVNVRLSPVANDLQVEISNGKWVDKTLSGVLAWTFFAPLIAAPVIGIYRQKVLVDRVIDEMNLWLIQNRPRQIIDL